MPISSENKAQLLRNKYIDSIMLSMSLKCDAIYS